MAPGWPCEHLISLGRAQRSPPSPASSTPTPASPATWATARPSSLAGLSDQRVAHGDFSEDSGVAGMKLLLDEHPDLDAVFVASDAMAAGALGVLRERGRSRAR